MRADQFLGLNAWARELLKGCGKTHFTGKYETMDVVTYEGEEESRIEVPLFEPCVIQEDSGDWISGTGDEYPLHKYTMRDGTVYYEYESDYPCYSNGWPMSFSLLALSIHKPGSPMAISKFYTDKGCIDEEFFIPESLWSDEEIANA